MSVELRRFIIEPHLDPQIVRLGTVVNRLVDRDNGAAGGRLWLIGEDDGIRNEILGGAEIDTGNYRLRVTSEGGNHEEVLHSDGVTVLRRTQDAGITQGATTISALTVPGLSTLGVVNAGATTVTTLTASGAATLNGNVTLGDAAGDTITVRGTPTFNENVVMAKNLTVDTTTLVVDATNNKVGVGLVPASTSAMFTVAGYIASTGLGGAPTTNANQVMLLFNPGTSTGILQSFNPGTSTWLAQVVGGLSVDLRASNVSKLKINSTGVGFNGATPVAPPSLPADATDLASAETLANAVKSLLQDVGLAT